MLCNRIFGVLVTAVHKLTLGLHPDEWRKEESERDLFLTECFFLHASPNNKAQIPTPSRPNLFFC